MTLTDEQMVELERLANDVRRGCPICGGPLTHDEVDNGVGMQRCGPDGCEQCQIAIPGWDEPAILVSPAVTASRSVASLVAEVRSQRAALEATKEWLEEFCHDDEGTGSLYELVCQALGVPVPESCYAKERPNG